MTKNTHAQTKRAFTLPELAVGVTIVGLLVGVLAPVVADAQARRVSNQALSEQKQRDIMAGVQMYARDNKNAMVGFWWRPGDELSEWADLNQASDALQAASNQAVDIIRRRASFSPEWAPRVTGWIPHVLFTHLVLADSLALDLPSDLFANPEDIYRICWKRYPDPRRNLEGWQYRCGGVYGAPASAYRWAFSSSYLFVPAAYDPAQSTGGQAAIAQAGSHSRYVFGGALGGVEFAADFPQQKVLVHDSHARHSGPTQLFYGYKDAEQPVAFYDGSVRVVRTGDANEGFSPRQPQQDRPMLFYYDPSDWEPGTQSGESRDLVAGWYKWTRAGALGVDVGGEETNTGNPGKDDDRDGLP